MLILRLYKDYVNCLFELKLKNMSISLAHLLFESYFIKLTTLFTINYLPLISLKFDSHLPKKIILFASMKAL